MGKSILALIPLTIILGGCYSSVPKCGDAETTDLVKQIAKDEVINQVGLESSKLITYSVNAIRTTNENDKTGSFECAAQLEFHHSNKDTSEEIPITYTVEMTDDGEQLWVSISGLKW